MMPDQCPPQKADSGQYRKLKVGKIPDSNPPVIKRYKVGERNYGYKKRVNKQDIVNDRHK
ncbi:hypothetical protein GCM10028825_00040 [Spirosoma agri]